MRGVEALVAPSLPRLDGYVRALPDGLASHPQCEQRAVLYLGLLKELPDAARVAMHLPPALRSLVDEPRRESAWISEVHSIALGLALCDLLMTSDDDLIALAYRMNRDLMTGALTRIIFMVVSPAILLTGASARWSAFHRGSTLKSKGRGRGTIRLDYPEQLVPELIARVHARGFGAVLEGAGSRNASVTLREWTSTYSTFDAVWS
jgi:hypothetical protein